MNTIVNRLAITVTAFLAFGIVTQAQSLSVADVEVLPGGTASFALTVDVGDGIYSGFQFEMQFPEEGFCTTGNSTVDATWQGGALFVGDLTNGFGRVSALSTQDKQIPTGDRVIGTVEIAVDDNVALGDYDVTISKFNFLDGTNYTPVSDVTFKVKVVSTLTVVLDENSVTMPESATNVNVKVLRTIKANDWSTICLPFAMTTEQVREAFGEAVQLGDFAGYEAIENSDGDITDIKVRFNDATAIEANHPYIIKVSEPVTEFHVDGVDVEPDDEPVVAAVKRTRKQWSEMIGAYVADTGVPENTLFISGNKFWYSTGLTRMKAFRGYFDFYDVLTDVENASAKIGLFLNDEPTGIETVRGGEIITGDVYTVSGQLVGKNISLDRLGRGVYIVNGKKYVVKSNGGAKK